MANAVQIEVCVDSISSALEAFNGGASRLELCSALGEGGLTPSPGMLKILKAQPLNIPMFCMLRPRRGNDFQYSEMEMEAVLYDMEILASEGCDGFVFGALDKQGHIAVDQCAKVIQKAGSLPVTFHRAFDVTPIDEMDNTVKILKQLNFQRILTSGFKQKVDEGLNVVAELVSKYDDDIIIMPGSGISISNLERILRTTKCKECHTSGKNTLATFDDSRATVSMGINDTGPFSQSIANAEVIRKMVHICQQARL